MDRHQDKANQRAAKEARQLLDTIGDLETLLGRARVSVGRSYDHLRSGGSPGSTPLPIELSDLPVAVAKVIRRAARLDLAIAVAYDLECHGAG